MVEESYDEGEYICFRFSPSDEELIIEYLRPKLGLDKPNMTFILEDKNDMYAKEPWLLAYTEIETDFFEVNELFYFVKRTQISNKATGKKTRRQVKGETCEGCWKATGAESAIKPGNKVIGKKRSLSFYVKGEKKASGWIMTEYYLDGDSFQDQVRW